MLCSSGKWWQMDALSLLDNLPIVQQCTSGTKVREDSCGTMDLRRATRDARRGRWLVGLEGRMDLLPFVHMSSEVAERGAR